MSKVRKIGLREIRALGVGGEVWETSLPGFGARRQRSEAVSYFVMYRADGAATQRRQTIGRHGAPWTPDSARDEAKRILGQVASGADPSGAKQEARKALTVADLCDLYLAEAEAGRLLTRRRIAKKASTLATDRSRIERHIKPLLGSRLVTDVSNDDIEEFLHSVAEGRTALREKTAKKRGLSIVRGGQGAASRTTGLLGGIFAFAVKKRIRADNPVRGVTRFADKRRERRLSDEEYVALATALKSAAQAAIWPPAVAATRFLVLTGWRLGEALGLRRQDVDLVKRTALLSETKTGRSVRPLSTEACDIVRGMAFDGDLVFPGSRGAGRMAGFAKIYRRIAGLGGLPADVTPHVFRHSLASLASDLGFSEATVAALIGHKGHTVTSRYTHSADAVLLAAADAVADATLVKMGERGSENVIPLVNRRR